MKEAQPQLSLIIQKERQRINITQEEFAALCGVSTRTIQTAEKGKPVSRKYADTILNALGYTMTITIDIEKCREDTSLISS